MKKDETSIDEEKLMELMAQPFSKDRKFPELDEINTQKEEEKRPKAKQKRKPKTNSKEEKNEFQELFFQKNDFTARTGKTVSIRPKHHERLLRISRVIGENKVSLSNYLDNILEYHFTEFEAEIIKQFKNKYKPIL
ncbi:DUF3408 domain-containing protein [Aquimarina longa]|uniref:DUF3408 domain-containing protein n=1 Tax=Aquimarina longa TaxID=1080221 RepID=UPI000782CF60|nr:DUF3408 domain-containing protein [Aquimarina longa]